MTTLAEAVGGAKRVIGGPFGSKLTTRDYTLAGVPVIRGGNMEVDGRWIGGEYAFVSEDKVARDLKTNLAHPGDIIVTQRGTLGQVSIVPDDTRYARFVISQSQMAISVDPKQMDRDFLYYFLRSPNFTNYSQTQTIQTGVPHINLGILRDAPLSMLSLPEQRSIARTLGALDDKIELNQRMSATLEEMARALYRSWFVDFDPVHARALGQSPAHMDDATAALFPNSFGPDGLPKGWEMSTIGEVAETVGGATPKTKEPIYWDGPHRWATPRDLSKLGQPILFETDRTITDEGLAKISSGLSPAGTVLLSSRAPIGYVAIAQNPVAVNQGFIALRETDRISSVEAYFWVQLNMDAILANANGSTFQEISKKNFRPLPCVVAPDSVRGAFQNLAGTWLDRVAGLCAESANLAALRDTLLPRLMSGELRVREAEKQVEEVL